MKRSWMKVFGFTFRREAGSKGYICTTLIVALLLLALLPAGMLLADGLGGESAPGTYIERAIVAGEADMSFLAATDSMYSGISFENAADISAAAQACEGEANTVVIAVGEGSISVLIPDGSEIDKSDAQDFAEYLSAAYPYAAAMSKETLEELAVPAFTTTQTDEAEAGASAAQEVVGMLAPYVIVMLMYFMVLIYGQTVANSAVMEKTSKLMDLFLVSVKPSAMMLGKTLAISAAGLVQTLAWIFSAVGGCALGTALVKAVNPRTTLGIITVFEGVGGVASMFDPAALAVVALIIVAGFVLYCALAGVGGALASKPEELGSTNYLFTTALVISFLACLSTGESAGMISEAPWLGYVPFTAVLAMPGRLLTGSAGIAQGLVSAAIIVVCALALTWAAGKAYAMTAFYRGKPISPAALLKSVSARRKRA